MGSVDNSIITDIKVDKIIGLDYSKLTNDVNHFGCFTDDDIDNISLSLISHYIINIVEHDNYIIIDMQIVKTRNGVILQKIVDSLLFKLIPVPRIVDNYVCGFDFKPKHYSLIELRLKKIDKIKDKIRKRC